MPSAPLSTLTTMRVGGPAYQLITVRDTDALADTLDAVWSSGEDWLVLGGGSNLVVSDDGFDGTVLHLATRGVERLPSEPGTVRIRVQAGEPWDELVAYTVEQGWAGLEALSGIPGSTGASPIQNIGAYGQELSATLIAVDFVDYETGERAALPADELALGYRTSVFKRGRRGVVVAVEFALTDAGGAGENGGAALSSPVAYAQLADALGVPLGARVPLGEVRRTVLDLRGSKGMVLDDGDTDTWSAGSFFTNPIVPEHVARTLPATAPRWPVSPEPADRVIPLTGSFTDASVIEDAVRDVRAEVAEADGAVKLSAAWLIENAGVRRGFRLPGSAAAISSKHTLALTNTGGATGEDIAELARYVQGRVVAEYGILLTPEPLLVGLTL
ncbi:UDP-N-acetylmuramate dehydrogenase [Planctomonas psychrotolerans]|uniref:UDP-N-acetylmuramate dehydrogenase n=1 Tax=Planctomonas psychrotolerans TaxID=2528712 RepID=UPI00123AEE4C|nr:UDP-N-acetylmuramate dehydrogenase [Planctomonas psychrotolerans]